MTNTEVVNKLIGNIRRRGESNAEFHENAHRLFINLNSVFNLLK